MNILPQNSTFAQTKLITEISTILKKNVGSLRKQFIRKTSSIEEEPKRLLSSVSKHLHYILNSHHPFQSKVTEILQRYTNLSKNTSEDEDGNWEVLDSKKESDLEDESKDHGVGSNMSEQGIMEELNYVPILLNDSSLNSYNFQTTTKTTTTIVENKFDETNSKDGWFDQHSIYNTKCQT